MRFDEDDKGWLARRFDIREPGAQLFERNPLYIGPAGKLVTTDRGDFVTATWNRGGPDAMNDGVLARWLGHGGYGTLCRVDGFEIVGGVVSVHLTRLPGTQASRGSFPSAVLSVGDIRIGLRVPGQLSAHPPPEPWGRFVEGVQRDHGRPPLMFFHEPRHWVARWMAQTGLEQRAVHIGRPADYAGRRESAFVIEEQRSAGPWAPSPRELELFNDFTARGGFIVPVPSGDTIRKLRGRTST